MSLSRRKFYSFVETRSSHPPAPSPDPDRGPDLHRRPLRWVRRAGVQALAGDGAAGSRADVLEIELPGSVFILGPAHDQRSPLSELVGAREDASLGGTLDDDLEPESFHRALRQGRILEARDPLAADFHRRLNRLRAFLPHLLDHIPEGRFFLAGQDEPVPSIVHVDLVQYRGHGPIRFRRRQESLLRPAYRDN